MSPPPQAPPAGPVIVTRGLTRTFGPRVALDSLDLDVDQGEVFGLLGPNGAGKSTLMRILVGAIPPSSGRAQVLGFELPRQAESLRQHVGYMPQSFSQYAELTVEENLDFAAEIFDLGGGDPGERRQVVEAALAAHGLGERRGERAGDLSGGWKQRLALAVATIHRPRLLLLDEPTAGIDPEQRRLLWDRLFVMADEGVTLVVSTHLMDEARRCHRLCMMRRGKVVALGTPRRLGDALSGRVFDVRGTPAAAALRALQARPEVTAVTQLGPTFHVLVAAGTGVFLEAAGSLTAGVTAAGVRNASAVPVEPSLEDVFVSASLGDPLLVREAGADPRPPPRPRPPATSTAPPAVRGLQALRAAWRRILAIARQELRQAAHDRLTMGFIAGVPLLQLILFGYAINQDVRGVATAVLDRSQSAASRRVLGELAATQTFGMRTSVATEAEARERLARGEVQAVVMVPPDFAQHYLRRRGAQVSLLVDASDPLVARAARLAVDGLARDLTVRRAFSGVRPDLVAAEPFVFTVLPYYNPELRTPVYVVPGLVGVILTTTMILLTAVALVRERERGTFEFLIGTPVGRAELMLGKILPYVAIGLLQVALILAAGRLLFRVPVEGSLASLGAASLLFIAANLALGLLISAVVRTQLQATQMAFFLFLPSVLLSGFMFPFASMPEPARWLGELLPLTHYIRLCRAVLLRGSAAWQLPGDMLALAVFAAAGLLLASRVFRKQLD
jgi:ABC-type multidrug transport system ATPase subunit/ABC-type multidrug transport system permease subunit